MGTACGPGVPAISGPGVADQAPDGDDLVGQGDERVAGANAPPGADGELAHGGDLGLKAEFVEQAAGFGRVVAGAQVLGDHRRQAEVEPVEPFQRGPQ